MFRFIFLSLLPLALTAIPAGERVVHGDASVVRPSSEQVLILQKSPTAIVDWDHFSLAAGETARFEQPNGSASILNRVTGGDLSEIYGQLEGNGRIFLVNPHGVLIGKLGRIDCASFLATSLEMENRAFIDGKGAIFKDGIGAKVVNRGKIRAFGGPLFLISSDLENTGDLEAKNDAVYMITAEDAQIDSFDRPKVMIRPTAASLKGNLSAYALAVNQEKEVEANYVHTVGGRVFLDTEPLAEHRMANSPPFVSVTGVPFAGGGLYVEESLDALQQLRTLIPDRLWEEEFAVLINRKGFQEVASAFAKHPRLYASQRSAVGIGSSEYYFMHAATSGEPIRLDDRYLEFLDSPYWKTPEVLYRLYYLQHNYQKVPR